jgi:hypothetical protein
MGKPEVITRNEWAGRKHVRSAAGYNLYFLKMMISALFRDINGVYSANFIPTFGDNLWVPCSRVKKYFLDP